jgi:isohexenylglutaconyl-CoA hydratase
VEAAGATIKRLVLSAATSDDRAVLDDAAESLIGLLRRPVKAGTQPAARRRHGQR